MMPPHSEGIEPTKNYDAPVLRAQHRALLAQQLSAALLELTDRGCQHIQWHLAGLRELGYAQGNICSLELAEQAHPPAGLDACRSALAAMEQAARSRPGDAGIKADLANRHAWLADALNAAGNKRDALAERQQQATIMDDLLRIDPANAAYRQDWMLSRYSMATLLSDLGDKTGARGSARLAMQAANRLIATDPDNRDWLTWRLRILQSFPDLKTEK